MVALEKIWGKIVEFFAENGMNIVISILVLFVGLILIKFFTKILKKALSKSKLDPICHKFIASFTKIALYIVLLITVSTKLGIPTGSLVTLLGAASLAIGLAIQDSLSNLAGGFIVLFTKPFKVGDFVEIADISGKVAHINILQTKLETVDNKAVFIPNGQVSSAKIINYSKEDTRRLDLVFSIGYNDDFKTAQKIITDIVDKNPMALKEPKSCIRMCEHGASSINIATRVWVKTENYWDLNFDLLEEVKAKFDENKINIPYNQLDVYIKEK